MRAMRVISTRVRVFNFYPEIPHSYKEIEKTLNDFMADKDVIKCDSHATGKNMRDVVVFIWYREEVLR